MKRPLVLIVVICLLIMGGAGYLLLARRNQVAPDTIASSDAPSKANQHSGGKAPNQDNTPGSYISYSTDAIAQAKGRKILFFHAPWCPQCRALEKSIQGSTIPPNITIFKVDYDSATDLRQRYGVILQTTLVEIDSHGSEVQKYVAYDTPSLSAVINAMKL